jgi:hypothetical protein
LVAIAPEYLICNSNRLCEQVNTTLTELDIDLQDPGAPIGAAGQAALLAALQVQ